MSKKEIWKEEDGLIMKNIPIAKEMVGFEGISLLHDYSYFYFQFMARLEVLLK